MPDEMMGAPPMAPPPAPVPPGSTAPATIAPRNDGVMMQARIKASLALKQLEQAAMMMGGTQSKEGQDILSAVIKLSKHFGSASPDVSRAEVKSMGEQIPPVQQPAPMQGQALQQAIRAKQQGVGVNPAAA